MEKRNYEENYFTRLNDVNVNEHTEPKGKLTYLSWAWAWAEVKKRHPDANVTIYEWTNSLGCPQNYFTDGRTCWVKTGVTIEGIEHIEYLPVMDARNKSIALDAVTSFDVNTAIQRSITKGFGRHGLGLYIYAGEDLPEVEQDDLPERDPFASDLEKEVLRKSWISAGGSEDQLFTFVKKYGSSWDALTREACEKIKLALAEKSKKAPSND